MARGGLCPCTPRNWRFLLSIANNGTGMAEAPKKQEPSDRAARLNPPAEERLLLKLKGRIIFLNLCDIDWIEASGNHVRFHVGKESHLARMPLNRVSEKLAPSRFCQVHRSIIVNVDRIKELIRCSPSEFIVVLQDGKQLPCGRHYSGALKALFKDKL